MSETLLDRAKSNYRMAEKNFQFIHEDDMYLNLTGYLLQQSVELALKHILEVNAIRYPRTHDIFTLIDLLPDSSKPIAAEVYDKADTITSWESKTRYIKNFRLSEQILTEGFSLVKKFLDKVPTGTARSDNLLLDYIDESEIEDFYKSIPSSIVVDKDNVQMLTSMYKSLKRR